MGARPLIDGRHGGSPRLDALARLVHLELEIRHMLPLSQVAPAREPTDVEGVARPRLLRSLTHDGFATGARLPSGRQGRACRYIRQEGLVLCGTSGLI